MNFAAGPADNSDRFARPRGEDVLGEPKLDHVEHIRVAIAPTGRAQTYAIADAPIFPGIDC